MSTTPDDEREMPTTQEWRESMPRRPRGGGDQPSSILRHRAPATYREMLSLMERMIVSLSSARPRIDERYTDA